jgi:uncharacterized membrane protein YdbT with pleckstrin-like domain
VGRLEVGAPIPSQEQIIWEGHPSFAHSIPKLVRAGLFFFIWLTLYGSRNAVLNFPAAADFFYAVEYDFGIPARQAIQYVAYILLFFMFLNVLKIIRVILRHLNTKYTITTQRIVIQTGLLNITSKQLELYRLKDYSLQQPLWARIWGYANVNLVSSDRILSEARLWGLPDARTVTESMRRAAQVARAESGSVSIRE